MSNNKENVWSPTLRWLHFGLALAVTLQLFLSLVMEEPGEAEGLEAWAFMAHELFGLTAFALALLHWGWVLSGHDGGWRHLFPWDRQGRQAVWRELSGLLRGRLPEGGPQPGLPGLVEGVGLGLVTLQGASGFVIFLLLPPEGELPERFEFLSELHEACGSGVWIYWFGHVGMALLHRLRGDAVVARISPFKS
ncbi:hypothetical protein MIT9_P1367 [Methylomarinovum caldicuralii]|uniref:Cytochrome b561 bacterial/Ni-hydrogenase domain-containing protein n=1 Tax=Methylomarinovum caldicuralii TaxID=438856 RepID=A0AAU9CV56_9GAMM|nr:cytochrome b/b6 domain-containing protein [Methylomarinovum caldicuralii]BCX81787.1 hypothetical protein MIT9_P1367 [Methylomarinovum caldicuralii]